ncbi:hypothetical protein M8J76_016835 [Diaphorina citri]|nr:hypothetical protein M8J75_001746 [Diaphorina citri]KAI5730734.1 hypothetical protein M8J76_016835 [Diaphorina citri]
MDCGREHKQGNSMAGRRRKGGRSVRDEGGRYVREQDIREWQKGRGDRQPVGREWPNKGSSGRPHGASEEPNDYRTALVELLRRTGCL